MIYRRTYPVYHVAKGVSVSISFIYILVSNLIPESAISDHYLVKYFLPFLTIVYGLDGFRKVVIRCQFVDSNGILNLEYVRFFFWVRQDNVEYSKLHYLSYNALEPYNVKNIAAGVTDVHFYTDRKYVAKISSSQSGWSFNDVQSIDEKLQAIAIKYKLSPKFL